MVESLHEMGHPYYSDKVFPYELKCSTNISELKELVSCKTLLVASGCMFYQVIKSKEDEKEWSDKASKDRVNCKWLSFLTNGGVLELYKVMCSTVHSSKELIAKKIFRQLRFLIPVYYSDGIMNHFVSYFSLD